MRPDQLNETSDSAEPEGEPPGTASYAADVRIGGSRWPWARERRLEFAGGLLVLVVAAVVYAAFSINGILTRDASIYVYGGQQLVHGVPPYASIFDPKTPFATFLNAFGAAIGGSRHDVHAIRLVFYLASLATVVAVYLLALRLWRSTLGAVVSALVFVSFWGFARDALAGPNAKTPGIFFAVFAMWLLAGRKWFWGGLFAGLTFLVWQPLIGYPVIAVVAALLLAEPGRRLRAAALGAAGVVAPIAAVSVYFVAVGAFGKFVTATVTFPLTGVARRDQTVWQRVEHIFWVVHHYYGFSGVLLEAGLVLALGCAVLRIVHGRSDLAAVLRDPFLLIVFVTLLFNVGYAMTDFQSYPDLFPLLPYGALMWGWGVAAVQRSARPGLLSRAVPLVAGGLIVTLMAFTWMWFWNDRHNNDALVMERNDAAALAATVVPGTKLWVLGDPTALVLTHSRNPDRFIYLESGVARWKIKHTPGGVAGWQAEISRVHPSVVVLGGWNGPLAQAMKSWLYADAGYKTWWVGRWRLLLSPAAVQRAFGQGVPLRHEAAKYEN
jgi:hypothetical protein